MVRLERSTRQVRVYQSDEVEPLAVLYREAVLLTGATAYEAAQCRAWAAFADDLDGFRQVLAQGLTLVAVKGADRVAFGQLHPWDHVALLFTAPAYARQGHATALYQQLEAQAQAHGVTPITVTASRIAKNLFLKLGFRVVWSEWVDRQGVLVERFQMRKPLV
jgi:putative acetyltransferase